MSGRGLRVTVCELTLDATGDRYELAERLRDEHSDLLLLPELPFAPWLPGRPTFHSGQWRAAVEAHDAGICQLSRLPVPAVVTSRPVEYGGRRYNEAFLWTAAGGYRALHVKSRLPAEAGFWETAWFEPGPDPDPVGVPCGAALIAVAVCSELWDFERARSAGQAGVNLLAVPRATSASWNDRWLVAGRAAALTSGAFCLSSNRVLDTGTHPGASSAPRFGGCGWVIDPDGMVLAQTTRHEPLVTVEIDLRHVDRARSTYPRNLAGPGLGGPAARS
jgi:N-carbamoylputrescine amidase